MKNHSVDSLHKKLWKLVSEYSRRKDTRGEYVNCCTCGYSDRWKNMQAGHFISARFQDTRYEKNNIHAQCPVCNGQLRGNIRNYNQFMLKRYGENEVERLRYKARKLKLFWTEEEVMKLIDEYKLLLATFDNRR